MKKVSAEKETAILAQLQADIAHDPKKATDLNTAAIKKIYKAEACTRCGEVVSMLSEKGLCGYCEHTSKYLSGLGQKGGTAGRGRAKRRGSTDYYKRISTLAAQKRQAKKQDTSPEA